MRQVKLLRSPRRLFGGRHAKAKPISGGDERYNDNNVQEWTGVVTLLRTGKSPTAHVVSSPPESIHVRVGFDSVSDASGDMVFLDPDWKTQSAAAAAAGVHGHHDRHALTTVTADTERTATTAASTVGTAADSSSISLTTSFDASTSSARSTSTACSIQNALLAPRHKPVDPTDWGFPGYLTADEHATLVKFQSWIEMSTAADAAAGQNIIDAIFSFGPCEEYYHALCRWLRARKFVLEDTIAMVKEAVAERTEGDDAPTHHDFYPSAKEALGVEEAIYKTQYPQCFPGGTSKDGKVLFFSKPGRVNIHGLELVSTPAGVNKYQWSVMHHSFASVLRDTAENDPLFVRYQSCVIMDLEGLSRATCNSKVLNIVQHQSRVDALCFPEILGRCLIINAPSFFSMIWSIIKRWLDPRTAGKIEIYSSKAKAEKRLKELIAEENLPREYGGTAPNIDEMIVEQGSCGDNYGTTDKSKRTVKRRATKLLHIKGHASLTVNIDEGEEMEVEVFTRSVGGAKFSIERIDRTTGHGDKSPKNRNNKSDGTGNDDDRAHRSCLDSLTHPHIPHVSIPHLPHLHVHHNFIVESNVQCPSDRAKEDAPPYSQPVARSISAPGEYQIVGESMNKSGGWYLVVCNTFDRAGGVTNVQAL